MTDQTTPSIVEFLAARLQEDEDTAQAVDPGGRPFEGGKYLKWRSNESTYVIGDHVGHVVAYEVRNPVSRAHIARHDPARVLREVAAKRALLDVYEHAEQTHDILGDGLIVLTRAIHALAAVYSYHPSYREEWKP